MLTRLKLLGEAGESFAFETTLAGRNYAPWLKTLCAKGYRAHLAFFSLPAPELALARVTERVRQGGHDVPEDVVRRRFAAGLTNFFDLYQQVVDSWQMFDNSGARPRLLATRLSDGPPDIYDVSAWENLLRRQR
jgi:predicted ABC-type ATPase